MESISGSLSINLIATGYWFDMAFESIYSFGSEVQTIIFVWVFFVLVFFFFPHSEMFNEWLPLHLVFHFT